ncbi:NUDIX hydrolase [Rothia kristinae]|uniref:NUDIX hydrolase n=1 Tax=Rothia kristinae TaxID=37923 RepID=UPI00092A1911|nr:NUDIX domain-containing protein [Rothia kristinae]MCA1170689.1 NUDIX hydrolase [Rothia kristinae]TDP52326.1 hypothetical protein DEU33_1905 [Kocuria sp. AG109]WGH09252.1 NUDIX hydrolase [Rothia kristinae]SIM18626.1 hydrolase, NUDIX family protein [Mycobacteroides abscessus subsp. abscessus]
MSDEAGTAPGLAGAGGPVGAASAPVQLAVSTVILALRPDEAAAGVAEAGAAGTGGEAADAAASASDTGAAGAGSAAADGRLRLWLPLVRRIRAPYRGLFALPGGPLPPELSLEEAAASMLRDATGLVPGYLEQLYAFGRVHRGQARAPGDDAEAASGSPAAVASASEEEDAAAERVVSVVYWASVPSAQAAQVLEEENVRWFPVDRLPRLAFDHREIVDYALTRLRAKVEYSRVAHSFLDEEFTLAQLREVYEAILGRALDPANFRRRVAASRAVIDTGRRLTGTPHRPPRLYRYDDSLAFADSAPPPQ